MFGQFQRSQRKTKKLMGLRPIRIRDAAILPSQQQLMIKMLDNETIFSSFPSALEVTWRRKQGGGEFLLPPPFHFFHRMNATWRPNTVKALALQALHK